ncbi:MAG: thiol reductase thioredoxin [Burkholderiales bacterium PBB5]|nr:MAG: thiol reductase thioredoxin [Burkholderiales bacterium PBB5]
MSTATDTHHVACAHCGAVNRLPTQRLGDNPDCGRCHRPLLDGSPVELDDRRFDDFVRQTTLPVLVDFWAPWCGPCRQMAPQFEAAARQLKGRAVLVKVNSDDSPEASARLTLSNLGARRYDTGLTTTLADGSSEATDTSARTFTTVNLRAEFRF